MKDGRKAENFTNYCFFKSKTEALYPGNLRQRMTPEKKMKKTIFWESSCPRKAAVGRSKKRKAKPRKARQPKRWLLERYDNYKYTLYTVKYFLTSPDVAGFRMQAQDATKTLLVAPT